MPLRRLACSGAPAQIVRDARDHGVEVRPVCVNASRWDCTLEPTEDDSRFAVRLGLRMVKDLANTHAAAIVTARTDRPFTSVDDLWRRAGVPVAALTRIAEADGFRPGLGLARREALWAIKALRDAELPLFAAAAAREGAVPEPRFLLTGLMKCGCCGGGFSTIAKDRFGCSNSRNKGTSICSNRTGIGRQELEGRILTLLAERLMDPALVKAFAAEYIAERNRLAASHVDDRAMKEKELAKVIKDQDVLVNAILAGTPAERIRDRLAQLERRQKHLEAELAIAPAPTATTRLHPRIAETYHERIRRLIAGLTEPDTEGEAREAIRGLIDRIVITPEPTGGKRMRPRIELRGSLAAILRLSLGVEGLSGQQKTSCEQKVLQSAEFLVAGVGFEPTTFRL